ncbi:MAG: Ig-like domain-containing protein, partial [Lachnospiraceae bacterium]|nr:Ig-like domain-containing protein [Lachnospiraceae bacterium]
PDNATDKSVRWTSSEPDTASVTGEGIVKGMKLGKADITVMTNDQNKTAVCHITVIPIPAEQVLLNKDEAYLTVGQKKTLVPTVLPEDTTDKSVTWKSSNDRIVTVDTGGEICGRDVGYAVITATTVSGHRMAICEVIVTSTENTNTLSYSENEDGSTTVTGSEGEGSGDLVIPGSFHGRAVTSIGMDAFRGKTGITGRLVIPAGITSVGTNAFYGMYSVSRIENNSATEIPVSSFISEDEKEDMCLADEKGNKFFRQDNIGKGVYHRHYLVKSVDLDRKTVSVEKGRTLRLSALVLPDRATDKKVVWLSSDEETAYVSADGTVAGMKKGQVQVKAVSVDSGLSDECIVSVYETGTPAPKPTGTPAPKPTGTPTPKPTDTPTPKPTGTPAPKPTGTPAPKPTGTPAPKPTPTASPVPVRIIEADSIKLNKKKVTVVKGKTVKLKATIFPSDVTDRTVTWKSSNKKVATVDKNGKVKGKKKGTATITATTKNGKKYKCKVTVKNPVKVKSIKLNKKKATVKVGGTLKLKVTFKPKKPTNRKVTWKSSNKKIATVDKNGKIKAKKKGKVTITATSKDGKKKAKCKVTVK